MVDEALQEESLGQYLKRQRELRKIALEEISRESKIHLNFLIALEMDRYEQLPGKAFVRGFLKAYAEYVGLDFNDILLRYDLQQQKMNHEEKAEADFFDTAKRQPRWKYFAIATVLVILVVLAAYLSQL